VRRETCDKVKIVIILGPTASGKTELALRLAERFGGEIVNADSMQVYRGMDIGTAKPPPELLSRVPHHLMDLSDPDGDFSASDFRREASRVIADIHGRGRNVFLVGGTGLYIKALLRGLADTPSGGGSVRKQLEEEAGSLGGSALLARLAEVDPETAGRLHPNDLVRIIRALEVWLQTGSPISRFRSDHRFGGDYYDCLKIGIRLERGELYQRIEQRVDRMISEGLVREVAGLLSAGFTPGLKPLRSIGYKEICAHLAGEMPLDDAVRLIKRDSRRYAKRQLTWLARDDEIKWVEYPDEFDTICNYVIEFFAQRRGSCRKRHSTFRTSI
jgi:tRNA dimethylallyltransferase